MVENPLDAFFRRFEAPKAKAGAAPPDRPADFGASDVGDSSVPDVRNLWKKVQNGVSSGMDGNEKPEHLTKVQQEDLESLLRRYSLDNDEGGAPAPEYGAEEVGEGGCNDKTRNGKDSSQGGEEEEGCCGCCSSLTYWERLLGCLVFFTGGCVLEMGSLRRFTWLIEGDPLPFVALWTLGHVVSICGSLFLVGPKQQCKNMFIPVRAPATAAYLACLGLTLTIVIVCIILDRPTGLVLSVVLVMLLFVQCLCILWYTASCVPFLRDYIAKEMFGDKITRDGAVGDKEKKSGGGVFGFFRRKRQDYEEIPS